MKSIVFFLTIILIVTSQKGCPKRESWIWKIAYNVQDAINFLNGVAPYKEKVKKVRIGLAGINQADPAFYIFYQKHKGSQAPPLWYMESFTNPDDLRTFLNGPHFNNRKIADAQICAKPDGNSLAFYLFYQLGLPGEEFGHWLWKLAPTEEDALNFLNGSGSYQSPVITARIADVQFLTHKRYYIFYQWDDEISTSLDNWAFFSFDTSQETERFLRGEGDYLFSPKGFEITSCWLSNNTEFGVFVNKGDKIWLQNPIQSERFVKNEKPKFQAVFTRELPGKDPILQWSSDLDGILGEGAVIEINNVLSTGTHKIKASFGNYNSSKTIRVFNDNEELYQAKPSQAEIDRVLSEFSVNWINGNEADEKWENYNSFAFDQSSTDPAKMQAISKIDILRHQKFSKLLPFIEGKSIYDHIRSHVGTINLYLNCYRNSASGDTLRLRRLFNVWDARSSGNPDCKSPFDNPRLNPYLSSTQLIIHEGRHCEPDDLRHTTCESWTGTPPSPTGFAKDQRLENGSGYAWASMYLMWVYKYSKTDSESIKFLARNNAISLLRGRFCERPTHSNPDVQALLDELLNP